MRIALLMAGGCFMLTLAACASGITTPLPDVPSTHVAPALNLQDRKKAVSDLEKAGAEHEEAAEREIEQSR
jgi:hypothetical protein